MKPAYAGQIRLFALPVFFLSMRLALYQPDIPQNTGTMLRMAACLGLEVDIIEPAGFDVSDRNFRRSGMDYLDAVTIRRHVSFAAFLQQVQKEGDRLILCETDGAVRYTDHAFRENDILLMGRESAGVPQAVYQQAHGSIHIPQKPGLRSLNVAIAAAMICGEALRQLGYP